MFWRLASVGAAVVAARDSRAITSEEHFAKEVRDATPLTALFHDGGAASTRFLPEFEVAATMLQRLPLNRGYPLQLVTVDVGAHPELAGKMGERPPPLPALATCFWDAAKERIDCLANPAPERGLNVYKQARARVGMHFDIVGEGSIEQFEANNAECSRIVLGFMAFGKKHGAPDYAAPMRNWNELTRFDDTRACWGVSDSPAVAAHYGMTVEPASVLLREIDAAAKTEERRELRGPAVDDLVRFAQFADPEDRAHLHGAVAQKEEL